MAITALWFILGIIITIPLLIGLIYGISKSIIYFWDRDRYNKLLDTQKRIKNFYDRLKRENVYTIYDETPAYVKIGNRIYAINPIKFWQYCKIQVLLGDILKKMEGGNYQSIINLIAEHSDEAINILALLCTNFDVSKSTKEEPYIKHNLTQNDLLNIGNVIMMQNNISIFADELKKFAEKKNDKVTLTTNQTATS